MMRLVQGGTLIADHLNITVLPRAGDIISITDSLSQKVDYTVLNVEFFFQDTGKKYGLDQNITQYDYATIINVS